VKDTVIYRKKLKSSSVIALQKRTLPQFLDLLTKFSVNIYTIIPLVITLPTKSPTKFLSVGKFIGNKKNIFTDRFTDGKSE
jgi:type II secretory pathway component PulL